MRDWLNRAWYTSRMAGRDALIIAVIIVAVLACAFALALLVNLERMVP